jgi:phosphohistidine phosphatase
LGLSDKQWYTDRKIYEADTSRLLSIINRLDDGLNTVMIVGHNPGLSSLVQFLTGEWVVMSTCSVAEIEIPFDSWTMAGEGTSNLLSFDFPKRYV